MPNNRIGANALSRVSNHSEGRSSTRSQDSASNSANINRIRNDIQRLQSSFPSSNSGQSNSTQNNSSFLDIENTAPNTEIGNVFRDQNSVTSDQKNKIVTLLKNAVLESKDVGNVFNDHTLDAIVGEVASITGDYPISSLRYDPNQAPFTGVSGQIYDKFKGEQKYDTNGAPLALNADTLTRMVLYVEDLPERQSPSGIPPGLDDSGIVYRPDLGEVFTPAYKIADGDKASNYSQFFADYDKGMTVLINQLSSPGANGSAPMIDATAKSLLKNAQINIAKYSPNSPGAKSLGALNATDEAKMSGVMDQIYTLMNNGNKVTANDITKLINDSNALSTTLAATGKTPTKPHIDVDPSNEQQFDQFKIDFFSNQQKELKKLQQQWQDTLKHSKADHTATADSIKFINKQLDSIDEQMKAVRHAKRFWINEENFWSRLGKAGSSDRNQDQIGELSFQLTQLENQMDQVLPGDGKPDQAQIKNINKQIADIKSQITKLHSGI